MAFTKMGNFTFNHAEQPDKLNLPAAETKAKLDSRANELKTAFNAAVDLLNATAAGNSGADNVGAAAIDGIGGASVQAQMVSMKGYVDAHKADTAAHGAVVWKVIDTFTRASDATFTVADNATNQAIFVKGRPIRYKATGGSYVYGIVTGYAAGTVTLAGAPMTTSYDDVLEYGDFTRVVPVEVMIPSSFAAAGASSTLINTVLKSDLAWRMGKAYLVQFYIIVDTDDSGANQTRVNVNIAGSAVGTANTNAGVAIAETWQSTTTDINTSNYDIAFGEAIELTCDANGTNDDAKDLTVSMIFVLE